ncbi:ATP-binding protein [Streptomyces radiopugnans]|uniref:Histidine kinase-, DNA gyrase B-, and HSP90-like ATPase n=1 Tax=Streptomyces radiopugnans TaxID=403935 RepID=A0A1H9CQN1_9ACTN|nr:ATP-binding protein [Streptomyces radiopugnans]SEQ02903.1 Histidine kinase-, DNA gyrase B-, and HSP90-like ATPase [Streptomyces radiopugnans]
MKITPSARVLSMLGEIDFDEWQCVAELVDNPFDDFLDILRSGVEWPDGFTVSVALPSSPKGVLEVRDTGRGMSYDRLARAVRAGWSGNDMHDKLGLFGMGFNISTARLGRRTRVLTTRAGDTEWIGVEIDLDQIKDDFEAKDITEPKSDPSQHGTRITVDRLHRTRAEWLRRNGSALRNTLGSVYSWILTEHPFDLYVGGTRVKPVRHCRWGDDRYVLYNGKERIPAYIQIDEKLQDGIACRDCGEWQIGSGEDCSVCGSGNLAVRERRIHGWLGVQRYLDKTEYGIDFLRNGRKILRWDKQLFTWNNPDGIAGNEEPEYPVELAHQGGRLIGEIHLDHVPVTYQKDAFEYGDRSWLSAVELLRGVAPLQPQRARKLGYPENESPLALLFKGFRRNDAGLRCLVPGDGNKPVHADTRDWGRKFQAGVPEFQTDEHWWQAVLRHEEIKKQSKEAKTAASVPTQPDEKAVGEALGFPADMPTSGKAQPETASTASATPAPAAPETRSERLARYENAATPHAYLSRSFGHPELGYVKVRTLLLKPGERLLNDNRLPVPVLLDQRSGNELTALVDPEHAVFQRFGADYADLLVVELAAVLKVRARSDWGPSQLVAAIRAESLQDSVLDGTTVGAEARDLLAEIRERVAEALDRSGGFANAYGHLSDEEKVATEEAMIAAGRVGLVGSLGRDSGFVHHMPALALVRLVQAMPESFMDGGVFRGPYAGVSSPSGKALSLARVTGCLADVATLGTFAGGATTQQLRRARLSIALLRDELAGEG